MCGDAGTSLAPFGVEMGSSDVSGKVLNDLAGRSEPLDRASLWMERVSRPQPSLFISFPFVVWKLIQPSRVDSAFACRMNNCCLCACVFVCLWEGERVLRPLCPPSRT